MKLPKTWPQDIGEAYHDCRLCGTKWERVELKFKQGSVVPVVGETLTGAASGDKGVVTEVELLSGTWAGGDAAGYITMSGHTGGDKEQRNCFDAEETVTGSTAASLVAADDGIVTTYGRLYPRGERVDDDGLWYCTPHYKFIHWDEWDDYRPDIDEIEEDT